MEPAPQSHAHVIALLRSLGIELNDTDEAVVAAAHQLYAPALAEFMQLDLSTVDPELPLDPSREPSR